jgi:hypothetical protein
MNIINEEVEMANSDYPVTLSIDYQEGQKNRLTNFFRIFMVIPIAIILGLLAGASSSGGEYWGYLGVGGILFIPTLLMILFVQKYPRWWFDWNYNVAKFCLRVFSYFLLFRDEYPSTDEEQAIHLQLPYPDVKTDLKRWLPIFKWILAIPHFIVLYFLYIAVVVVQIIAWFAILFTGSYPKGMFDFVLGVVRWSIRVMAYAFILVTDKYPPFAID